MKENAQNELFDTSVCIICFVACPYMCRKRLNRYHQCKILINNNKSMFPKDDHNIS